MLNILLPMAGTSPLARELAYPYPSALVEICGVPLIQHVIDNLMELDNEVCITAVLRLEECRGFHLDSTIKLLAGDKTKIISLQKDTAGALCSVLMAVENFCEEAPLVIANTDQIFDRGILRSLMRQIEMIDPDAACPTFDSVHPRWSYLRLDGDQVIEAVEKNPISRHAVAGLYYFKSGKKFTELAMRAIMNGRDIDGSFFISSALNEYILDELKVVSLPVEGASYHSFFTAQRVLDYELLQRNIYNGNS